MKMMVIVIALSLLCCAGCPPHSPLYEESSRWTDADEWQLTPIATGQWFQPDVASTPGTTLFEPYVLVVIDGRVTFLQAKIVRLRPDPQANVAILYAKRNTPKGEAVAFDLTYPVTQNWPVTQNSHPIEH